MRQHAPRLLIGATTSGSGKTTFTCGLLRALQRRDFSPAACKCGPDYIDPMFHRRAVGAHSRNLDLFLSPQADVMRLMAKSAAQGDITIIEGVMGYYDGIALSDEASAWDLCVRTKTPAVLVVDARGKARSIAAEVTDYAELREPSMIAGVILNRVSISLYPRLKELVEKETGVRVFGFIPALDDVAFESRHLGLVTADEIADLQERLDTIASVLEETVDIDALVELAKSSPQIEFEPRALESVCTAAATPLIAVARDEAFCFYYEDALETLKELGARIVELSLLSDNALPEGASGLYIGGGYPELYAGQLSKNESMRTSIAQTIKAGMPVIAECGGFAYLQESMEDERGVAWPMVGALAGDVFKTSKLQRFGYVTLDAKEDSMLFRAGESVRAHEFHYWDSNMPGSDLHAHKPKSSHEWDCGIATSTMYAGYPHFNIFSELQCARRFVCACREYGSLGDANGVG